MTTDRPSSTARLAPTVSAEFVHRWFTQAHPNKDEYDVTVLRYAVARARTWCLMPTGLWREVPMGTETTPWLTVPGHELNPHFGQPGFRALVETAVRTAIAPRLEQLQVDLNWAPMAGEVASRRVGKSSSSTIFTGSTGPAFLLTGYSMNTTFTSVVP